MRGLVMFVTAVCLLFYSCSNLVVGSSTDALLCAGGTEAYVPLRLTEFYRQKPCVPGRFNHAGVVCGGGNRHNITLVLLVGGWA